MNLDGRLRKLESEIGAAAGCPECGLVPPSGPVRIALFEPGTRPTPPCDTCGYPITFTLRIAECADEDDR